MSQIKVGVLRGGPTPAYEDSLKTGAYVLSLLREMPEDYEPLDIFISRDGDWHYAGLVEEPHKILSRADIVWNSIHGPYGEDGQIQRLLENLQVPFVGSSTVASTLSHNKGMSKELYRRSSLRTPESRVFDESDFSDEKLIKVFRSLMHPVIVKPGNGVRALGVRIANTFQELKDAVRKTFAHSPKVLVEEYIQGSISSCTVIEDAKGEKYYALVPSGRQPVETNKQIEEMAKKAHEVLNQRHYSSSDFVVTPKGKIYILETNSVPVLHEDSHLHRSLCATGWKPREFVEHCLKMVRKSEL
jgi:D-alanine-D-alanine ligase